MIVLNHNPKRSGMAAFFPEIPYSTIHGVTVTLDLIVPIVPDDEPDKRYPLIVFVQGSAWSEPNTGHEIPQLSMFAQQGYVIATVRHRNRREGHHAPAFLKDVKTAIRFLRAHAEKYHIDPEHVGAWGTSSGGNTVLLLAATPNDPAYKTEEYADFSDHVDAVMDCFGPTDLVELFTGGDMEAYERGFEQTFFGGKMADHMDLAEKLSPYLLVKEGVTYPPFLIAHGDKDMVVPYSQSEKMIARLKEVGADVHGIKVTDAPHEGSFWSQELFAHIMAFFDQHLM